MKKKIIILLLTAVIFSVFAEEIVISRTQLANFLEQAKNLTPYTPDELSRIYDSNSLQFENRFYHNAFLIGGRIVRIRRSIFDEYIVELECNENFGIMNFNIVYPKKISEVMKSKLMNLYPGQYYEALVVGRKDCYYGDVPVWNQNGVYRTEP